MGGMDKGVSCPPWIRLSFTAKMEIVTEVTSKTPGAGQNYDDPTILYGQVLMVCFSAIHIESMRFMGWEKRVQVYGRNAAGRQQRTGG